MDKPYSNREQDARHEEVLGYLKRIETQVIKTNGRVNKLEEHDNTNRGFNKAIGIVVLLLVGVVLSVVGYFFTEIQVLNNRVTTQEVTKK